MSAFVLKIIAMITMVFDHIGYLVFGSVSFFNYIGRLAFPIFAFQISEGYIHTKNVWKYMLRLFIFALISQVPFAMFVSLVTGGGTWTNYIFTHLNIFFTLLLGLVSIYAYDKTERKRNAVLYVFAVALIGEIINVDYGFFGVIMIVLFYALREKKALMSFSFIGLVAANLALTIYDFLLNHYPNEMGLAFFRYLEAGVFNRVIISAVCTMLSVVVINLYNGKKGRDLKQILYFFYPVHLVLIYVIWLIS